LDFTTPRTGSSSDAFAMLPAIKALTIKALARTNVPALTEGIDFFTMWTDALFSLIPMTGKGFYSST